MKKYALLAGAAIGVGIVIANVVGLVQNRKFWNNVEAQKKWAHEAMTSLNLKGLWVVKYDPECKIVVVEYKLHDVFVTMPIIVDKTPEQCFSAAVILDATVKAA